LLRTQRIKHRESNQLRTKRRAFAETRERRACLLSAAILFPWPCALSFAQSPANANSSAQLNEADLAQPVHSFKPKLPLQLKIAEDYVRKNNIEITNYRLYQAVCGEKDKSPSNFGLVLRVGEQSWSTGQLRDDRRIHGWPGTAHAFDVSPARFEPRLTLSLSASADATDLVLYNPSAQLVRALLSTKEF
jgi:hypothetical protein